MTTRPAAPPGLILAGGRSLRMGENKPLALLDGRPLILHVTSRLEPQTSSLAIAGPPALTELTGLRTITDARPDFAGPLSGLLAGLRDLRRKNPSATHLLTSAADTPFLPQDFAERLTARSGKGPAVARSNGRLHPVAALWPVEIETTLDEWLIPQRKPRLMDFLAAIGFEPVDFEGTGASDPFFNINTPTDLDTAGAILAARS